MSRRSASIRSFARLPLARGLFACASIVLASMPAAAIAAGTPAARPVVDPTVPPPGFGAKGSGDGAGAASEAPAPVARVQMIVRGPGETRIALIAGHSVRVGDRVQHGGRDHRVVQITDGAVMLQDTSGADRPVALELVPGAGAAVRCSAGTPASKAPRC